MVNDDCHHGAAVRYRKERVSTGKRSHASAFAPDYPVQGQDGNGAAGLEPAGKTGPAS